MNDIRELHNLFDDWDNDAFLGLFMAIPAMILFILGVLGMIEYFAADRLHLWSVVTFITVSFYGIALSVAGGLLFHDEKLSQGFLNLTVCVGLILTTITFLITLWQIHWLVGLIPTVIVSIIGGFIVTAPKEEEDD